MNLPIVIPNRRILVIDDNQAIHADYRKILGAPEGDDAALAAAEAKFLGTEQAVAFEIDAASQGAEGLQMVERSLAEGRPYAMAFVDMRMPPGWDGVETTKRLWQASPELQIVICTAFADCSWEEVLEELQPLDRLLILKKPFDSIEVLQLAKALTEKWRLRQESKLILGDLEGAVKHRTRELEASQVAAQNMMEDAVQSQTRAEQTVEALQREMTEHNRAEQDLRLRSAVLDAAANEIVITHVDGTIQWVNPAFTRATGYTLEEAIGQNPRFLQSGKHDREFYHKLWATILRGEVWHSEIINRRKDKSLFTQASIITPVKDERGTITHFVAIMQDITEKKLLEAKFLRAQRLEGLGALAGGVAHDLNNVLAPILMCAEMLKSAAPDEHTQKLADMIQASTQRGAGMIRQILAFARGTAGDKVSMQVKHLLKDLSRMMKDTFPPNIRLEQQVDENLSLVKGEPTELYQVLLNLCVNARDAMPGGGTITLSASNVRLDTANALLGHEAPPGPYVVLAVADTGSGIPPEIQAKIFDAFFTTKEAGKGTGLGLATVKDIVTGHNGFIHLYSEVGVGTQFKIYLPAVGGAEAASDTTFQALPTGHGELILVVDDEAAVREIVKATLEANGYRVVFADDGTQAVARFVEHLKDVQLLFTDMQMPHMDGIATIRALRNIRPDLRVIAASGLTAHQQALKVMGLNVQGFIAKPFTAASLLLALDGALHPK